MLVTRQGNGEDQVRYTVAIKAIKKSRRAILTRLEYLILGVLKENEVPLTQKDIMECLIKGKLSEHGRNLYRPLADLVAMKLLEKETREDNTDRYSLSNRGLVVFCMTTELLTEIRR